MDLRERVKRLKAMIRGHKFLWLPFFGYFVSHVVLVMVPFLFLYFKYIFSSVFQGMPAPGAPPPPPPPWILSMENFFKDPETGMVAMYDWFMVNWGTVLGWFSLVTGLVLYLYSYAVWVDGFYTERHLAGWKKLARLQKQEGHWETRDEAFQTETWQPVKTFTRKKFWTVLSIHVYVHLFMILFGGGIGAIIGKVKGGMPTENNILTWEGWRGLAWGFGCSAPLAVLVWLILWAPKRIAVMRYLLGEEKGPLRALLNGIGYAFSHPAEAFMAVILEVLVWICGMIVGTIVQCVPVLGMFLRGAVNLMVAPVSSIVSTDYLFQSMGYEAVYAEQESP